MDCGDFYRWHHCIGTCAWCEDAVFLLYSLFFADHVSLLSLGNKSLEEVRQLYYKLKDDVFGNSMIASLNFNTDKLQKFLQETFGEMKMNDVKYPR